MKLKDAKNITGGLSNPEKMPGYAYNLPATACRTGSKLRKVEGSVCSQCYACKGRYNFKNVQDAMQKRLDSISEPLWVEAMTVLIKHYCKDVPYFRFHDSGDLQNMFHLDRIVTIVKNLPDIKFWLPTIEMKTIREYFFGAFPEAIPSNLNVRMSCSMIDTLPESHVVENYGGDAITTSSVATDISEFPSVILCPATMGAHVCGDCRKCWDKSFKHVIYVKH